MYIYIYIICVFIYIHIVKYIYIWNTNMPLSALTAATKGSDTEHMWAVLPLNKHSFDHLQKHLRDRNGKEIFPRFWLVLLIHDESFHNDLVTLGHHFLERTRLDILMEQNLQSPPDDGTTKDHAECWSSVVQRLKKSLSDATATCPSKP